MTDRQIDVVARCLIEIGSLPPEEQIDALAGIARIMVSDDGRDTQQRVREVCRIATGRRRP